MLTEYEGIIDAQGLRTFNKCTGGDMRLDRPGSKSSILEYIRFWAVIESQSAAWISEELDTGSRVRAMRMLEELAVSLGSKLG